MWPPSQLLQTAVHLPFALLPCPGPALGAELLQVFFEVLVVHGAVAGGLTVRLQRGEDEMRGPRLTAPPTCKAGSSAHWVARSRARLCAGQISRRDTAMPTRQIGPSKLREGVLRPPETPPYLAFQEELLVPALQDI